MSDSLQLLVDTLVTTTATMQQSAADGAIRTAYAQVKLLLERTYPSVDLSRIEAKPDSQPRRASLVEDLAEANAANDAELWRAMTALLTALHQSEVAVQSALKIGVDLARIRAAALKLVDIAGEDIGTRVRDSEIRGAIEIQGVDAGQKPRQRRKQATPTRHQLIGNTAQEIHIGDKNTYLHDPATLDLNELEQHYLQGLYAECNELPLASDGPPDATQRRKPRLQHIYVDLNTDKPATPTQVRIRLQAAGIKLAPLQKRLFALVKERGESFLVEPPAQPAQMRRMGGPGAEGKLTQLDPDYAVRTLMRLVNPGAEEIAQALQLEPAQLQAALAPLSALEAITTQPQLVFLGDPGGGKSTLTRRLAGLLAAVAQADLDAEATDWLKQLEDHLGRWLLPVRIVLSRWAAHLPDATPGVADDLIDECLRLLGQTAKLPGERQKEHFTARLTAPKPTVLLLLDGLDEVADEQKRPRLLAAVRHFCARYAAVPLIVTCRIRPWQAWEKAGQALPLPTFTLAPLTQAGIARFVERWHAELVRMEIYPPPAAVLAQTRLQQALADPTRSELREMAGTPLLLTMMARVNYSKGLPNSRAALYEEYVRQLLWEWERQKLDDRGQPTSLQLLLQQDGVSATSLERALAQLAYQVHAQHAHRDTVDIARSQVRDALERIHPGAEAAKAAWAVQVLRLLDDRSGLLYSVDDQTYQFSHRTLQEYLAARWLATGDFLSKFKAKIDQEPWREAVFLALGFQVAVQSEYDNALSVIYELLPEAPATDAEWRRVLLLGEAYVRLLGTQRAGEAEQQRRARDVMRDLPVRLTAAMQQRALPARQRLEAGLLLADLEIDPPGLDDFVTADDWAFKIARYPVTNKQYRRFVEAGGYTDKRWWQDEAGRKYKNEYDWREPRYWDDARFNHATQPVVGVSWYEACAYCAWLTEALRNNGQISKQAVVRLPTQTEWEQAARSHDNRDYAWGQKFDAANANTKESALGQTTPVYMYPDGATPEGVWDLSGNIWEWTTDIDKDGLVYFKGGSRWDKGEDISSSARYRFNPDDWYYGFGFRCVVVPISR